MAEVSSSFDLEFVGAQQGGDHEDRQARGGDGVDEFDDHGFSDPPQTADVEGEDDKDDRPSQQIDDVQHRMPRCAQSRGPS
jgi:hypothetical protein